MHRPDQFYTGKKTAYLDHNILNYFVRYPKEPAFAEIFKESQVIYSDETLREIKRSKGSEDALLKALMNLGAMHLKPYTDENFEITGEAILTEADIYFEYARTCNESLLTEKINSATQRTLQKFYGSNETASISQLADQQSKEFEDTFKSLLDDLSSAQVSPEQLSRIKNYISRQISEHARLQQASTNMMQHYQENPIKAVVKSYRDSVGIGPLELNNLTAPNIIEKIWDLHQPLPGYKEHNFTIEDFLGLSLIPKNLNGNVQTYNKIISIYNVLNVIGYWNDSNMKQSRRFTASMSDANHVALASFTDSLYSSDISLINKAKVIYEYLNAHTNACKIVVNFL
ncbi:hypothetical protein D3C77_272700 [compost metagenome]